MAGTGGEGNEHVAARVPCLQRFTAVEFSKLRAPPPGQANTCGEKAETDLAALFLQYKCPARDRLPVSESLLLQTLRSDVSDVTGDRPCVTRGGGKDSADSAGQPPVLTGKHEHPRHSAQMPLLHAFAEAVRPSQQQLAAPRELNFESSEYMCRAAASSLPLVSEGTKIAADRAARARCQ